MGLENKHAGIRAGALNDVQVPMPPQQPRNRGVRETDFRCPGASVSKWELNARIRGTSVDASPAPALVIPVRWLSGSSWTPPLQAKRSLPVGQALYQLFSQAPQPPAQASQAPSRLCVDCPQ